MYSEARFQERLEEDFGGRLRLRWSKAEEAWLVEEKVGRGAFAPTRRRVPGRPWEWLPVELDDSYIRARDGYARVLAIQPGDRMRCPVCRSEMRVPVMRFGEARCGSCQAKGRRSRHAAAFFPLGETLLDHLKRIDPLRGDTRARIRQEDEEARRAERIVDKDWNQGLADHLFDEAILQIPKVGYTGKEKAWVK